MANHPPHPHNPNDAANTGETQRPPTSDEQLRSFWIKNEKSIYIACAVVIVVVVIVGFWRSVRNSAEDSVGSAYAAAATPDKLRTFINDNPGSPLAAAAALRLADDAYQKKNYAEAAAGYDKAAADKTAIFAPRALLGAAMSKILGGQDADGENRLNQIINDATLPAVIRAEAAFHTAMLSENAGRSEAAAKLYDQVSVLAPKSPWAEAASYQRDHMSTTGTVSLPITVTPAATPSPAPATPATPATPAVPPPAASGTTTSELPEVSFPAQ